MIVCNRCRTAKSEDQFYVYEDRIVKTCKDCMKEAATARYHRDPERHKKKVKEWQRQNPSKIREYTNRSRRKTKYYLTQGLKKSKDPERLLLKREKRKTYALYLRPELFEGQTPQDDPFRCHRCGNFYPLKSYHRMGERRKKICPGCYSVENHERYERKKNDSK